MTTPTRLLDIVRIASPCPVSWEGISGDERTRHCSECNHKVYNLSAISRAEAERLLALPQEEEVDITTLRSIGGVAGDEKIEMVRPLGPSEIVDDATSGELQEDLLLEQIEQKPPDMR